ncbi:NodT family efflux transporter outer membrane factor (OMF) lipoprotein [Pontibacter ummariensis]|uniref:Efflux transporter, outer membrane factor (OMF) lipoprotein, NodT family n=1 Tax=Pontibacter ummariensis TaxID=1610492 RepID=A0A239LDC9_9BACT|nr:efflux transporter outer membrane subunit [Pontibacter ummariensis]PRY03630.1 NodT family efflux transporter outer membrane factor (OMF) lipoprotein [Pontibacter ummariensis]SNT28656.1 efflux transporter, outer membrane factor (OMF) lipoprotein, NodT family [Pontibacter ummariensis]
MYLQKRKLNRIYYLLLLMLISSCKVGETSSLPGTQPIPASFGSSQDTASVGDIRWQEFFTDPQLVALIDTALHRNPDLLAAVQQVEIARANLLLSKGALLPQLQGVASAGVQRYGDYTVDGVGNYDTNFSTNIEERQRIPDPVPDYFLGLRSSWEIDVWGKLRSYKKAAYNRFMASEKGRQLVATALVANVANLYYELLALHNELEILDRNIKLQEIAVALSKVQKAAGRTTELGVQQFRAQLLNTKGLREVKQQEIVAVENRLNHLLGRYPQPVQVGEPLLAQRLPAALQAGVPSDLLRRRPDVQQAELLLKAAKADVDAARKAFLPSVSLSPFIGFNSFDASMLFATPASIAYGLLGGLTAPLINRTRLKVQLKRADAEKLRAFYAYQKAVQTGLNEVMTNLKGIENYRELAAMKAQEVEVLQDAVTTSNDLFRAGYASYLEIITAQRRVLEAELNLVRSRQMAFHSMVDLYRSLGGGWQY